MRSINKVPTIYNPVR